MITKPFALSPSIPQESLVEACHELVEGRECDSTVRQAHSSPRTVLFYCALALFIKATQQDFSALQVKGCVTSDCNIFLTFLCSNS